MANVKSPIGNTLLVAWLIFALWAGIGTLNSFGEEIGSFFPAYLLALIATIFLGRFIIVSFINSLSIERLWGNSASAPNESSQSFQILTSGSFLVTSTAAIVGIIVCNLPNTSDQSPHKVNYETATDADIQLISEVRNISENLSTSDEIAIYIG